MTVTVHTPDLSAYRRPHGPARPDAPAVSVRDLVLEYPDGEGRTLRALDEVSLAHAAGTFTALIGPSGARPTDPRCHPLPGRGLLRGEQPGVEERGEVLAGLLLEDGDEVVGRAGRVVVPREPLAGRREERLVADLDPQCVERAGPPVVDLRREEPERHGVADRQRPVGRRAGRGVPVGERLLRGDAAVLLGPEPAR